MAPPPTDRFDELVTALAKTTCFTDVDPNLLRAVAREVIPQHYDAGQMVLLESEASAGLGVIASGRLKAVRLSASGREQILSVLGPGEIFNAVSVLAEAANPATIVALDATELWMIPKDRLDGLQDRYPQLTRIIARNLARRVLALVDLVEDLSLRTVEMRLARQILEHAEHGVLPREPWATQAEMSARLGTVTYVLNRALRGLEEEGLIDVERDRIRVLDADGLAARAEVA